MSYKAITIYTPAGSQPHIAAEDDAFIYDSIFGGSSGTLGALSCTKQSNNTVRLSGGGVSNGGFIMYIPQGDYCELSIQNGTQGLIRHDLVVAQLTKGGGSSADTHCFAVVTGTAGSVGTDPTLVRSELASFGDMLQLALFRVVVNGLEISSIEPVATALPAPCAAAASLSEARQISISGDASGVAQFDGTQDVSIALSVSAIGGKRIYIQAQEPALAQEGDLWLSWTV